MHWSYVFLALTHQYDLLSTSRTLTLTNQCLSPNIPPSTSTSPPPPPPPLCVINPVFHSPGLGCKTSCVRATNSSTSLPVTSIFWKRKKRNSISSFWYKEEPLLLLHFRKEWTFVCTPLKTTLQWYHNEYNGISNNQRLDCLLNQIVQAQIKENIKSLHHWPLRGNTPVTSGFPSQRASNAENVSIWWRHHHPGMEDDELSTGSQKLIFHSTILLYKDKMVLLYRIFR